MLLSKWSLHPASLHGKHFYRWSVGGIPSGELRRDGLPLVKVQGRGFAETSSADCDESSDCNCPHRQVFNGPIVSLSA